MTDSLPETQPSPIRLFVDARCVRPGMTGVGRYTLELLLSLAKLNDGAEAPGRTQRDHAPPVRIRAAILGSTLEAFGFLREVAGIEWIPVDFDYESHPRGDLALQFKMPGLIEPGEIYHGPAFVIPGRRRKFARVVTIHDMGVFNARSFFPRPFAAYMRRCIKSAIGRADRILVPCRAIADEIAAAFPDARAILRPIHYAPIGDLGLVDDGAATSLLAEGEDNSPSGRDRIDPPAFMSSKPYILTLGAAELRKGIELVEHVLRDLRPGEAGADRPDWVWAGPLGHGGAAAIGRIAACPERDRFHHVGFQSARSLDELKRNASAFVYPTHYEGFGLPPLEAMATGLPVVVSDIPVMREVCGDAALFFPSGDAPELAACIRRLLDDLDLRAEYARRGRAWAARFTWEKTARRTLEVYREIAAP